MNYINQINGFWAESEKHDLSGIDISVYMSLLFYCNKLSWLNPFVCHWDFVCQKAQVSKNSYYNSLQKLESVGFIKYEKGVKNQTKPKVFILEIKNKKGTELRIEKEQNEEQKGNLYKLLNKETIKLINDNASLVNENIFSWIKSVEYKPKIDFDEDKFVELFNSIAKKNIKKLDDKAKRQIQKLLKKGYSKNDILNAIKNCAKDDYHIQNPKYLTPEFITREDKFQKYFDASQVQVELPADWFHNQNLTPAQWALLTPSQRTNKENNDLRIKMGI